MEADEYEDDVTEDEDEDDQLPATSAQELESAAVIPKGEEPDVDMDPSLADWFKVDDTGSHDENIKDDPDSATDDDSDNADVADGDEDVDLDDWFSVKEPLTKREPESIVDDQAAGSMVLLLFFFSSLLVLR